MKILTSIVFIFLFTFSISAQFLEGEIVYQAKVNLHNNIPDEMAHMKDQIPEYRTSNHILHFTATESYFFRKKKDTQVVDGEAPNERRRSRFRRSRDNTKLYTDLQSKISLEAKEFFGKKFLIEGEANNYQWKFTGKSKQVGSYFCQQAVHQDTIQKIEVWFSPMIPVSTGPENFTGLPGLILHVDIDDGNKIITALEVNNTKLEEGSIVKPTEGKSISRSDYKVMAKEKMKEREQRYGGRSGWRFGH